MVHFCAVYLWFLSRLALFILEVFHLPFSPDLVFDLTTGLPLSDLDRLGLVV